MIYANKLPTYRDIWTNEHNLPRTLKKKTEDNLSLVDIFADYFSLV